ncbi:MAG: DUF805 domain-containing protein [Parasphingopyxis sp.]|uniref:DUF805 domain-containing protein n=1 Tax=Parasphingopyxis sp. TaxID=1920299 RepID=UPI003FA12AD0
MDFQQILQHGFRNVTNFEGRDSKRQFLTYYLAVFLSLLIISAFLFLEDFINVYEALNERTGPHLAGDYLYWEQREALNRQAAITGFKFAFLGIILPFLLTLSSMVRRLHDAGFSGKWLLMVLGLGGLLFFPALPVLIAGLAVLGADADTNRFGDPVGSSDRGDVS